MAKAGQKRREGKESVSVPAGLVSTTATKRARKAGEQAKGGQGVRPGESISGYFRAILKENPRLLKARSNEEILRRWLKDHPGEKAVPERVRQVLSNVKSILRSRLKRRGRPRKEVQAPEGGPFGVAASPAGGQALEALEQLIDECLMSAKRIDREGLEDVIRLLRRARNEVVWKLGV